MPKKTTILIVILAIITGVLIFLAVRNDQTQQIVDTLNPKNVSPTVTQPYASLSFSTQKLDLSLIPGNQSVDVAIDTKDKPVAGVQIELSYDPKVLTNVSVSAPKQSPFFGTNPTVLISSVDATQGRITYAVGISPDGQEPSGTGNVTTISFVANKSLGVASTQIIFLPKSAVTTLSSQGSILQNARPLQIILSTPTSTGN